MECCFFTLVYCSRFFCFQDLEALPKTAIKKEARSMGEGVQEGEARGKRLLPQKTFRPQSKKLHSHSKDLVGFSF